MIVNRDNQVSVSFNEEVLTRTKVKEVRASKEPIGMIGFVPKTPKSKDYVIPEVEQSVSLLKFADTDEIDKLIDNLSKLKQEMFKSQDFTLNNLEEGMVVETRNRDLFVVTNSGVLLGSNSWSAKAEYKSDLTHNNSKFRDIIKVYQPKEILNPEQLEKLKSSDIIHISK